MWYLAAEGMAWNVCKTGRLAWSGTSWANVGSVRRGFIDAIPGHRSGINEFKIFVAFYV